MIDNKRMLYPKHIPQFITRQYFKIFSIKSAKHKLN